MSRQLYPKQFIPLTGESSLFQQTIQRLEGMGCHAPIVVCNNEHRFMAAEQLRQAGVEQGCVMLEPMARNTAPAIAVAALQAMEDSKDAVLLVLPADHLIHDEAAFHAAIQDGVKATASGALITFGVVPDRPETGYGYIRQGAVAEINGLQGSLYAVDAFVEKPDQKTAQDYIVSGEYLWNSGMFMFRAADYLADLKVHAPEIYEACVLAFERRSKDLDFVRLDKDAFAVSPGNSIDYAVMEKTSRAMVLPLRAGWNDVGSWHSLWDAESIETEDNVTIGDVMAEDCRGCYINANHRLVAAVGMNDYVIVETADAVLVTPRGRSQDVRKIVDQLKDAERDEIMLHRKVYRPWGAYEGIDSADRFQVKRITVKPGQSLSLQMHHHRAEHWIIVRGTARITRDDEVYMLSENESTYIPIGARHRLENPGMIPLEMIEVQSGAYLGEDDIVRFEDNYGRKGSS